MASPRTRAARRWFVGCVRFVGLLCVGFVWFVGFVRVVPVRAQEVVLDRILAIVNGDVVTQSDVRAARRLELVPSAASLDDDRLVTQLIERRLILAEVARYSPAEPAADQLDKQRRDWVATLPAGTDLAKLMASAGMREVTLTAWLRDDFRIAAYLEQRFTAAAQPTREQALAYFREHEAEFRVGGTTPAFAEVEADIRRRVAAARRATRIREWIDSLRQRAEIRLIGKS